MIKNMEWGAVAYLKQSQYGLGETDIATNNNGTTYYTGGGVGTAYKTNTNQSTTGNIYGVYDMSGNADEYVMGNMVYSNGGYYGVNAGFPNEPDKKYYDKYSYGSVATTYSRGKLGDATKETVDWYSDLNSLVNSKYAYSWFLRGRTYNSITNPGIFSFVGYDGSSVDYTSRAVLS